MAGRRRFAANALAGALANAIKLALQIVLLPLMARLLGPTEFGLYALALPTVVFFATLADGGLGASLAREAETSTELWSTAFWVLLASCTGLMLITAGGGFVLANLSGQPRLAAIVMFLSLSFPLLCFTVLPSARLVRRGNLVTHSVADIVSAMSGSIAAVGLGFAGAGAWALAVQYVLGWSVGCLILNAAAFEPPTLEFRLGALRGHAMTSGALLGSRLSELVGRQVENLLFGRLFGAPALGSYTFANQASRYPCEAVGNPIWSALYSHALREGRNEATSLHATLSRLLTWTIFPAAALLAASAPELFDLVLGPRWAASAPLVQVMVPFYALSTVASQYGAVLLAWGRSGSLFWALTGLSVGRVLAVSLGLWAGPEGVAWAIGAVSAAYAVAMFSTVSADGGAGPWRMARELVLPLVASSAAGVVCHALLAQRPESIVWTAICLSSGGVTYGLGMLALQRRRFVADASALRRAVLRQR